MTVPVGSTKPHIRQLTGLRGIALLGVLAIHFQDVFYPLAPVTRHAKNLIDSGGLGVMIFFTLSGFIIAYTYLDRLKSFTFSEYGRFMWARVARMYPVHITMLFAILILWAIAGVAGVSLPNPQYYQASSFVVNLFMLQGAIPANPWNTPAWTLTYEMAAYLAFPLLALFIAKFRSAAPAFVGAAIVALAGTGALIGLYQVVGEQNIGGPMLWLHVTVEFTCGSMLYVGWKLTGFRPSKRWDVIGLTATAVALTVLSFMGQSVSWQLATIPLIVLIVVSIAGSNGPLRAILGSRVLDWFGRISYSLYLAHVTSRSVLRQVVNPDDFVNSSLPVRIGVILLFFAFAVACGAVLYHFVEEPARKWLRQWLARRTAPRVPAPGRHSAVDR